jgi:hypothetical protein
MSEADARAADNYLATQASREATWMRPLRLDPAPVKKESSLVAFADALSLALCGYLKAPMTLETPAQNGDLIRIEFTDRPGRLQWRVDVIVRRYEAATGGPAVLVDTGDAFDLLAARRARKAAPV